MLENNQRKFLIWLASVEGITAKAIYKLLTKMGGAQAVWDNIDHASQYVSPEMHSQLIYARSSRYIDNLFYIIEQKNITVITREDKNYPYRLKNIIDPPPVIYVLGGNDLNFDMAMAIVGMRRCTKSGVETTRRMAQELAESGVAVISGMALGIDGAAHAGCIAGGGKTVAVLANGVDVIYPIEHESLYHGIISSGGSIVSERPPQTRPKPWYFPPRNRIITGLADTLAVMEAQQKSGSLISVDHALDQGKTIFAAPGNMYQSESVLPNKLISQGASILQSTQTIFEEMGWDTSNKPASKPQEKPVYLVHELDDDEEIAIVELLKKGNFSFEEMVQRLNISVPSLNSHLTMLEIRGIIRQLPGNIYSGA